MGGATVTVTTAAGSRQVPEGEWPKLVKATLAAKAGRSRGAKAGQADIEDAGHAGVHPAQAKREAEVGGIAADRLRSIIERIERLEDERKALGSDIRDVLAEAKSAGFDVKVVRQVIRLRRQEPAAVEEAETLLDLYRQALGM